MELLFFYLYKFRCLRREQDATRFLLLMISSTVHVHKHREANINKNISRTFQATMPRLGTNKKDIILYNFA